MSLGSTKTSQHFEFESQIGSELGIRHRMKLSAIRVAESRSAAHAEILFGLLLVGIGVQRAGHENVLNSKPSVLHGLPELSLVYLDQKSFCAWTLAETIYTWHRAFRLSAEGCRGGRCCR